MSGKEKDIERPKRITSAVKVVLYTILSAFLLYVLLTATVYLRFLSLAN